MTSGPLVEEARRGNPRARERLARLLEERVTRTARHYARATGLDSDDLRQEMWLGMLLGLEQVDTTIGDPLCYLYQRGKWRLLEAIRRSERQGRAPTVPEWPAERGGSLEDEVSARCMADELATRLRGNQRLILQGLLDGYRQDELARRMECTAANVAYHVRQIRERYRRLAREWHGSTDSGGNTETPE